MKKEMTLEEVRQELEALVTDGLVKIIGKNESGESIYEAVRLDDKLIEKLGKIYG